MNSFQAWVEHQFMGDFSVQEFNAEDFQFEHEDRLNERNGQWLDENMNTSLWLSQGCYVSGKCIVEGEKLRGSLKSLHPFKFIALL